jgi:hypothetical protein
MEKGVILDGVDDDLGEKFTGSGSIKHNIADIIREKGRK